MGAIEDQYVRDISLVLDNDAYLYNEVRARVHEAIRHQMGYADLDPDTYDDAHRNRRYEFRSVVGGAVDDVLMDLIEQESSGNAALLLQQLTTGLTDALGENYIPEPDDYRDQYGEDADED